MARPRELLRLPAVDGYQQSSNVPDGACSLIVENPLNAEVWLVFGQATPSLATRDVFVSTYSLRTHPIEGVKVITARLAYTSPLNADEDAPVVLSYTDRDMGCMVGPLPRVPSD